MKKIILILTCLFIFTACNKEENVTNTEFEASNQYGESIFLPVKWAKKSGIYGDYFTDYEDIILITEVKSGEMETSIKESLNVYKPDLVSLNDNLEIKKNDDYYIGNIKGNSVNNVIIRTLEKEKYLVIVSKTQERAYELYKKIFGK